MVSAPFAATTLAEIVVRIAATRAADSSGAEQQNTLLKQCGAHRSHRHSAAGHFEQRDHAERRRLDL
jgi:hypothetical protein